MIDMKKTVATIFMKAISEHIHAIMLVLTNPSAHAEIEKIEGGSSEK